MYRGLYLGQQHLIGLWNNSWLDFDGLQHSRCLCRQMTFFTEGLFSSSAAIVHYFCSFRNLPIIFFLRGTTKFLQSAENFFSNYFAIWNNYWRFIFCGFHVLAFSNHQKLLNNNSKAGQHGGLVVSIVVSQEEDPGFKSRSAHLTSRVTCIHPGRGKNFLCEFACSPLDCVCFLWVLGSGFFPPSTQAC